MATFQAWVGGHQVLFVALLGLVFNLVTDWARAHRSTSKCWLVVDSILSRAFPDVGGFVRDVMALFGIGGGGGPSAVSVIASDPDMTPTRPSSLKMAILAGTVLLVGCPAVQDVLRFSADEVQCVFSQTDQGKSVADAVVACGITNTPDVLKFFDDLVAQRAAAKRVAACEDRQ